MYEMQLERLTPEFLQDFSDYTSDPKFGIEFLSTRLPQMRTIPVAPEPSCPAPGSDLRRGFPSSWKRANAPFAILECICRKKKALAGDPCKVTDREEKPAWPWAASPQSVLRSGFGREISRAQAMAIIDENQKQGLVSSAVQFDKDRIYLLLLRVLLRHAGHSQASSHATGFLVLQFSGPGGRYHLPPDAVPAPDTARCRRCVFRQKNGRQQWDLHRCIGCGVCVTVCPEKAISLF